MGWKTKVYHMVRGGSMCAVVVVLPNQKCIVSWPESTIVYDSEEQARYVHIPNMGDLAVVTEFQLAGEL